MRHCVPGVRCQIHQNLLYLAYVNISNQLLSSHSRFDFNVLTNEPVQYLLYP